MNFRDAVRVARAHIANGSCCLGPLLDRSGPTSASGPVWGRGREMTREMATRVLEHCAALAKARGHADALEVVRALTTHKPQATCRRFFLELMP